MQEEQIDMFIKSKAELFDEWVHTVGGRHVANRCIRRAWWYWKHGQRMGMKAIWEIERWRFRKLKRFLKSRNITLPKSSRYAFNNIFTPYMADFIMDREPRLKGFFKRRSRGSDNKPRRVYVVDAQPASKTA